MLRGGLRPAQPPFVGFCVARFLQVGKNTTFLVYSLIIGCSILLLTFFHASFFPFCRLCWPPLFLSFSGHLFALFSPSKSAMFCGANGTAHRDSFRMHLSIKFGKEIPSRNLCEKGSVLLIGRTPAGACNNAPFSEGFLEGFSRLLSRRF